MKNFNFIPLLLLFFIVQSFSTPLYLTFAGKVHWTQWNGYYTGQPVSFTFVVDLDEQGFGLHGDPNNPTKTYVENRPGMEFFYSEYLEGDITYSDYQYYYTSFYYGVQYDNYTSIYGSNHEQNNYDMLKITFNGHIPDLEIGTTAIGKTEFVAHNSYINVAYDLTLVGKSTRGLPAVPEPASFLLLGFGLVGGYLRKKHNYITRKSGECSPQ